MTHSKIKAHYVLVCLSLIVFTSCAGNFSTVGKTAIGDEQITIRETSTTEFWQTKDLIIEYQSKRAGNNFTLSGTVKISDRILYSYPIAHSFDVYANLLNEAGVVASRHNIRASVAAYSITPDSIPFSVTLPLQPTVSSFVFSYDGTFGERGIKIKRRADEITIYHQPFLK